MKYAIFSDSHDHFYNFEKALEIVKGQGITNGIHLGDFCNPGMFGMLADSEMDWNCVWGNVDADKAMVLQRLGDRPNMHFATYNFMEIETPDGKVFAGHFPLLAQLAAKSGDYRASFHGDNHKKSQEVLANGTLLANPGELAGFATGQPSFGIWDSATNSFEIIDLPDFKTTK